MGQKSEACRAVHEGASDVHFACPVVSYYPVHGLGLHDRVGVQFCHEVERALPPEVSVLQQFRDLLLIAGCREQGD